MTKLIIKTNNKRTKLRTTTKNKIKNTKKMNEEIMKNKTH